MEHPQHYKRRNRLPQPKFQLRLTGIFAGLCALALIGQTLVIGAQLTEAAQGMSSGGNELADAVPGLMWRSWLGSAALILPALMLIGVRITFRFAGPLFRMERHLEAVAAGEWPEPCKIREKDDMQDLCVVMNAALESARAQGAAEARNASSATEKIAA